MNDTNTAAEPTPSQELIASCERRIAYLHQVIAWAQQHRETLDVAGGFNCGLNHSRETIYFHETPNPKDIVKIVGGEWYREFNHGKIDWCGKRGGLIEAHIFGAENANYDPILPSAASVDSC